MTEMLEIVIQAKDEFSGVLKRLDSSLSPLKAGLAALATAAAAAAGGAGIYALVKATANQEAAFAGLEKKLGLSADLMSRLGFYAEKSGGSIDDMSHSLLFMLKNTSEAVAGNDAMRKTLDELGISIGRVKDLSPDEIFKLYVERLGQIKDKADLARLSMEIFGRGGGAMLGLLSSGAEGFRKASEEAEKYGAVISSQAAANAKEFKVSQNLVELAIRGVRNALFADLVPYFTAGFKTMAEWIASNRETIKDWAIAFVKSLAAATEAAIKFGARAIDIFYGVNAALAKFEWNSNSKEIRNLLGNFDELTAKIADVKAKIKDADTKDNNINWVKYSEAQKKDLILLEEQAGKLKDRIFELNAANQILAEQWSQDSSKMFNEDSANEFFEKLKAKILEIKALGTATVPEPAEADMKERLSKDLRSQLDQLKQTWNEYYLTESQRVDVWYAEMQEKFANHEEALVILVDVYEAKIREIQQKRRDDETDYIAGLEKQYNDLRNRFGGLGKGKGKDEQYPTLGAGQEGRVSEQTKADEWYRAELEAHGAFEESRAVIENLYRERSRAAKVDDLAWEEQNYTDKYNLYMDFASSMAALSAQLGKKGFVLAKAINIGQAIMSTYTGAANALRDLMYPFNLVAAATVIAFGMAQVAKIAAQKPPEAHTGLDFVPQERTYLLSKGERVVQPQANKKLTEFLDGGGSSGGSVTIEKFEVFPNVTDARALRNMDDREMEEIIEEKIIPAMRRLQRAGISA